MADEKKKDKQRCVTPVARLSFPSLWKATAYQEGQEKKFQCRLLFPEKADLSSLRKAVFAAKVKAHGADKTKWPKMASPFYDGNEKADLDGYKGMTYISPKNKFQPKVVKRVDDVYETITEESREVYAGCYVVATVRAYCYGGKGSKVKPGVAFSLENVLKHSNGKAFGGGGGDVADDFKGVEIEDGSEDESSYADGEDDDGDSDW